MPAASPGPSVPAPGLSRARLPDSVEALAIRALDDDEAARSLAEALAALQDAERGALFEALADALGTEFGRLLARLVGASADADHARKLVSAPPRPGRAFRDGGRVFLVARGATLEVAEGRVAVHEALATEGMQAEPLEPAIDEAARLLWRHHRGALPREARQFAQLFDPAPGHRRERR